MFNQVAVSILVFITTSLIGIFINKILKDSGVIRDSKISIIIGIATLVLLKPFVGPNVSWWIFSVIIIVSILAGIRNDLRETLKTGRWWWEREKKVTKNKKTKFKQT